MTYFNKNSELQRGYNSYIDESTNPMGTMMNVGLLVMEDGDTYTYENAAHEVINAKHEAIGNKALAFVGTSGVQLGWLASQADMLADDWRIVGEAVAE